MIWELISSWRTPARAAAKKLGYVYESVALEARAARQKKAWQTHWQECHRLVRETCQSLSEKRTVVVLGSGLLHEIPIEDLSAHFEQVILVDIVHPLSVRARVKAFSNVLLMEQDLLGLGEKLHKLKPHEALPETTPPDLSWIKPDLVISANLLSQLAVIPRVYVGKKHPRRDELELNTWCHQISKSHLEWLARWQAPVLMWTDTGTQVYDRQGKLVEEHWPYFEFSDWKPVKEWTWPLAPRGEMDQDHDVSMRMWAIVMAPAVKSLANAG